jgi:predicted nucleic acid-binding protein
LRLLVVDASVAAKWLVWAGEPWEAEALDLVDQRNRGQLEFVVPDLFWSEIGNILWKAAHRGRCTSAMAKDSIQALRNYHLDTAPSEPLLEAAFVIAQQYHRSFYDSLYVALAVTRRATLITADEKLANATAAYLPVQWIGSLNN